VVKNKSKKGKKGGGVAKKGESKKDFTNKHGARRGVVNQGKTKGVKKKKKQKRIK